MPLTVGTVDASSGLTQAIYEKMNQVMSPKLDGLNADAVAKIKTGWKELSFAIAGGVIEYLKRDPATDPEYAETFSSATQDATYWNWLSDFVAVFAAWSPNNADGISLRNAIVNFRAARPVPTQLRGVIQ